MGPCFSNTNDGHEFTELLFHSFLATFIFFANLMECVRIAEGSPDYFLSIFPDCLEATAL